MATSTPESPADTRQRISRLIRQQGGRADSLIEVLHRVQEMHGYLPKPALRQVAEELRMPLSRVFGVASFYHLFSLDPPARHRCAVCLGTACFVRGGADLAAQLEARLGVTMDAPPDGGEWMLQHVSCLGACGQAPVAVIDGNLITKLPAEDPEALDARLDALDLPSATRGAAS
ncbi:NADH-quinone oxidoreductase subunit E [Synechococcus sp. RSCCF101]|uniref:NADH-quinone oxidoreductase subunit NuoE family protein n=1 Tax=Synechococcus sp. RSCCF101 TaxID=2511069 RepID=UPI0012484A54|nr:NAD(P)H-dependent oxidoreductase subunit E [Synechococcus sp. RSCCF101]QEY33049.1 NADH-quinone oxidoreductase subunit E [Synechococcus sp. RSCCF101]